MEHKKATYKLTTPVSKEVFELIVLLLREQYGVTGQVTSNWKNETITINVKHDEVIDFTDRQGNLLSDVEVICQCYGRENTKNYNDDYLSNLVSNNFIYDDIDGSWEPYKSPHRW